MMTTICPGGWSEHLKHAERVLRVLPEGPDGISHGICSDCDKMLEAELDAQTPGSTKTETDLAQYGAYLASAPLDTARD